jgi:hypothetical protein
MVTKAAHVSSTRIFARIEEDEQILVYQNKINIDEPAAMVLPIPEATAVEDAVEFISMKGGIHTEFFTHLKNCFPSQRDFSLGATKSARRSRSADSLTVEKVGDFIASYVPSQDDFARLDPQFRLSAEVWDLLPQYEDFGFVVFQFSPGKNRPHPMAFKFKTRHPEALYFPTVHVHDGKVKELDRFDHELYMQGEGGSGALATTLDDLDGHDITVKWEKSCDPDDIKGLVKRLDHFGIIDKEVPFWRKGIAGTLPNKDFYVSLK